MYEYYIVIAKEERTYGLCYTLDYEVSSVENVLKLQTFLNKKYGNCAILYFKKLESSNPWIPVSTGNFPNDSEIVQITYQYEFDDGPCCDSFAYRHNGKWYWNEDSEQISCEVLAWKKNCAPYRRYVNESK